ncbi:maleylpyruvate isomerase family mycothiol-dependent enzyme [Cellulomonas alba]|uniref:Maleylpyruvate isomerase family mycothiol-dependent enzyme n=1 Tax=Cellulomonas alba TaxID=3053467 RepID=A0ABT7SCC4_9CELL|nr:maleylpyruvate isomerase family mycothiol-dependent enzyme [Cellulomonas alba]MDM7853786.1 maleylpyruvate isomerase family mycothiol-dependent enzyme [Cellulomonas alba]
MAEPLPYLDLLSRLQGAFLAGIDDVPAATRVPWCGRWRVRDLVVHLARIHHWAAAEARRRPETPLGRGPFDLPELYSRCAAELRETLGELDPEATASTLLGPGPVAFWHRRQVHETLVHLWDLRTAAGRTLDVEPVVWVDTVDEVVTVMQPRQERLGRMAPLDAPIALAATDVAHEWLLGGPAGDRATAATRVSGPAERLALLLWGRTTADDPALVVTGDEAALASALERRLTP